MQTFAICEKNLIHVIGIIKLIKRNNFRLFTRMP